MRLTNYTDYSLRVLIFLASKEKTQLSNIKEVADVYGISKNHLMKVTYELGKMGAVETVRGRNGGIRLAKEPGDINIGQIVRHTEDDFNLVECFNPDINQCVITPACGLRHALNEALQAYLKVLDQYTLSDLVTNKATLNRLFANA
ncbi:Rrf2 family transcriptional regulator [Metabacillus sp. GX 13764]|uniref:Rrf2 family transcriptional regulator n=1 Tax=Metabacillus kandeliae TaxID=2900151 RepID=UPI001E39262D|nr:Rrf2 family transcriptional regulator [Metabacillus kandeliae]MCD7035230.1 Rrf2 family transcriptional regulator [Metabacillus kandeliae]